MSAETDLRRHLRADCEKANVSFDTYDLDFILGALMGFLGARGVVLTATGLRRLRT